MVMYKTFPFRSILKLIFLRQHYLDQVHKGDRSGLNGRLYWV